MNYIERKTKPGDRWDSLANEAYGDPFALKTITDANPDLALVDVLPGGLIIRIPILPIPDTNIDISLLPPWKQ